MVSICQALPCPTPVRQTLPGHVSVCLFVCQLSVSMLGLVSVRERMQLHLAVVMWTISQTKLQGITIKTILSKHLLAPVSWNSPDIWPVSPLPHCLPLLFLLLPPPPLPLCVSRPLNKAWHMMQGMRHAGRHLSAASYACHLLLFFLALCLEFFPFLPHLFFCLFPPLSTKLVM